MHTRSVLAISILCFCLFMLAVYFAVIIFLGVFTPVAKKTFTAHSTLALDNRVSMHYRVFDGKAPALIFLHGFGGSSEMWMESVNHLKGREVYALDLIGFAASSRPSSMTYNLDTQSYYVAAFLKQKQLKDVILVGHSMGASVAAVVAAKNPEWVSGLVLIAPSGLPDSLKFSGPYKWIYRPGIINTLCGSIVSGKVYKTIFPDSMAKQIIDVTGSYDTSFSALLKEIHQPTVVLWSKSDNRVPISYSKIYLDQIENSQFYALPEYAGHKLSGASDSIAEAIETFMQVHLFGMIDAEIE